MAGKHGFYLATKRLKRFFKQEFFHHEEREEHRDFLDRITGFIAGFVFSGNFTQFYFDLYITKCIIESPLARPAKAEIGEKM